MNLTPGRILATILAGLVVLVLTANIFTLPDRSSASAPQLDEDQHLREALGWPWADFPPILTCEREELRTPLAAVSDHPSTNLAAWATPTARGPLSLGTGASRSRIQAARSILENDHASEATADHEASVNQLLQALTNDLTSGRWQVRYHLALLSIDENRYQRAYRLLRDALAQLPLSTEFGGFDETVRLDLNEAVVLTQHALGLISILQAEATEGAERTDWLNRSIEHCRMAVIQIAKLPREFSGYGVNSGWAHFNLQRAEISSHAVVNNLVVAYMRHPDYHYDDQHPDKIPVYNPARRQNNYREECFARTYSHAADDALGQTYRRLFHLFYESPFYWEQESTLWALSNAIDFSAYSYQGSLDPWLRYNTAQLLAGEGYNQEASDLLGNTSNLNLLGNQDDTPRRDYDRLETLTRILSGDPPQQSVDIAGRTNSSIRDNYFALYKNSDLERYSPADLGDEQLNLSVDQWLFITHWRRMLSDREMDDNPGGQFNKFLNEHDRLLAITAYPDFFTRWRKEMIEEFSDRAIMIMSDYQNNNETAKADIVARFLRNSSVFSTDVIAETFPSTVNLYIWKLRDSLLVGARAILGILVLYTLMAACGMWRAYNQLFSSGHLNDRKRISALTQEDSNDPPIL
jgi:hypothetical protein